MIQQCTCCANKSIINAASAVLGNITVSSANDAKPDSKVSPANHRFAYKMLQTVSKFLPEYRVSSCQQIPVGFSKTDSDYAMQTHSDIHVGLTENGRAKYGGLNHCGGVWLCPVCARNVAPTRVEEVVQAMARNAKKGGQSLFISFTSSHTRETDLKTLWKIQSKAMSKVKADGQVKRLLKKLGYLGEIRGNEATHSFNNGWHPHVHSIYMFDNITCNKLVDHIKDLLHSKWQYWIEKLSENQHTASYEHGVDIRLPMGTTDDVAAYVAKWGMEITMSHTKQGIKSTSRTPFQILADLTEEYSEIDHALIVEFAAATFRKRRLYWSPNLKKMFDIHEIEDEAIANKKPSEVAFNLPWQNYKALRNTAAHGAVLDILEIYGKDYAKKFAFRYSEQILEAEKRYLMEHYRQRKKLRQQIYDSTMNHLYELFPDFQYR